jgi:hypothetical protein
MPFYLRAQRQRAHAVIFCFSWSNRTALGEFCARDARRNGNPEEVPMEETMISEYARQLRDAHGDRAIAEAAQRAVQSERLEDKDEAKTWRQVEAALKAMRGPTAG